MSEEGFPAIDWRGRAFDCAECRHAGKGGQAERPDRTGSARCQLRHACVHDRYALRIQRFFQWNPGLGTEYLRHPYFEVRALAAAHADIFHLPRLLQDPDGLVRWNAVRRLPRRYLLDLVADPDREVRIRIAMQLDADQLGAMVTDEDYYVRLVVARRIALGVLARMVHDPEREVRIQVARRLRLEALPAMIRDADAAVRSVVAERLPVAELLLLADDPDWRVRYQVASRVAPDEAQCFLDDPDPAVRALARERLDGRTVGETESIPQRGQHEDQS